jgi:lactoylglutathione lyase
VPAVTGFFHGGITVADMDRSLAFYREGLGLEQAFDRILDAPYLPAVLGLEFSHIRAVYLHIPGGGFVELLDYGAGHLCLYVDDVEAMHAKLVSMGYAARSSAVVDITAGPNTGARSCYMTDPDGYAVELFQRPPSG